MNASEKKNIMRLTNSVETKQQTSNSLSTVEMIIIYWEFLENFRWTFAYLSNFVQSVKYLLAKWQNRQDRRNRTSAVWFKEAKIIKEKTIEQICVFLQRTFWKSECKQRQIVLKLEIGSVCGAPIGLLCCADRDAQSDVLRIVLELWAEEQLLSLC